MLRKNRFAATKKKYENQFASSIGWRVLIACGGRVLRRLPPDEANLQDLLWTRHDQHGCISRRH